MNNKYTKQIFYLSIAGIVVSILSLALQFVFRSQMIVTDKTIATDIGLLLFSLVVFIISLRKLKNK